MTNYTREASQPHRSTNWRGTDPVGVDTPYGQLPNNDHPWGRDVHRDIEYRDVVGNTQKESLDGLTQNEADVLADTQHEWV